MKFGTRIVLETQSNTKWTYPAEDLPFLEAWEGIFEAAIIALHPFIKIPGLSPFETGSFWSSFAANPLPEPEAEEDPIVARITQGATLIQSYDPIEAKTLAENPNWEIVTWDSIATACGFQNKTDVYFALKTSTRALKAEYEKPELAKTLIQFAEKSGVYVPSSGEVQAVHFLELSRWFEALGIETVILHKEFDDEPAERCSIPFPLDTYHRGLIRNEDGSIVVAVDWESFFTVILGPKKAIDILQSQLAPDIIPVLPSTTHFWWFPELLSTIQSSKSRTN